MPLKIDGTSNDSLSRTMYGKLNSHDNYAFPIIINTYGSINIADNFNIPPYDEITMSYTGSNLALVVYKKNSASVATINMTYDGSDNLTGVVKT